MTPVFAQFAFWLQSGSPTHTEVMLSPKLWSAFLFLAYTKPHYAFEFSGEFGMPTFATLTCQHIGDGTKGRTVYMLARRAELP